MDEFPEPHMDPVARAMVEDDIVRLPSATDRIDGLVAMARAHREPAQEKSAARLWVELLLIAAAVAVLVGGSICMVIDSVVETQQAQAFKG